MRRGVWAHKSYNLHVYYFPSNLTLNVDDKREIVAILQITR